MSHRVVKDLRWVAKGTAPWGKTRARGAKAKGLAYERQLARYLGPSFFHGFWLAYEDAAGRGLCQPDFMLQLEDRVFVLEAKYTWIPEAHSQIEQLYKPVVEKFFGLPVYGIVVCKKLVPEVKATGAVICQTLEQALEVAKSGRSPLWHWLGLAGPRSYGLGKKPIASAESLGL